jgi:hypothetical protein
MFGQSFYFQTIRKYVTLFGTLFNDISITRTDKEGKVTALIKVPITYAPKDKMLARVEQDPGIDRPTATLPLPMMSFEMTGVSYDSDRKLISVNRSAIKSLDNNKIKYQYNPVPYNFGFRLYIFVKNAEDGTKIVEQILPYFTPDFTVSVNLIPELAAHLEIPVVMNSIIQDDTYSGDFRERRAIIWTLDFTVKGQIYGPIKSGAVIKYANTVFYTPSVVDGALQTAVNETNPVAYIEIRPGLTANGEPTSNASLSIPTNQITATDDFGYIIEITENE